MATLESLRPRIASGVALSMLLCWACDAPPSGGERPEFGTLSVAVQPESTATVEVDGEPVGPAPIVKLKVEPGRHTVRLSLEEPDTSIDNVVTIQKGRDTNVIIAPFEREATPEPAPKERSDAPPDPDTVTALNEEPAEGDGLMSISAKPPAEIYVDGASLGTTPVIRHTVPTGRRLVHASWGNDRGGRVKVVVVGSNKQTNLFFAGPGDENSAGDDDEREAQRGEAQRLMLAGDWLTAIAYAHRMWKLRATDDVWTIYALAYEKLGDTTRAVRFYNRWLEGHCKHRLAPSVRKMIVAMGGSPEC